MPFDRLIRFVDQDSQTVYGNLEQALSCREIVGREVQVLSKTPENEFEKTNRRATVVQLLNPLEDAPTVLCSGLNYHAHIEETHSHPTTKPVVFMTPAERLTGPVDDIVVHGDAQPMLDYEGELGFVLSRDAKNVAEADALRYILGYIVANDVSARNLVTMEVAFNQMGHSKSFDTFGPIGPCIAAPSIVPDPAKLQLVTRVNGEVRQNASTADMVWSVSQLVAWLSKNRTLRRGTVVMTGTPSGVGWHSGKLLRDGDVVEVEISRIGSIANRVKFL